MFRFFFINFLVFVMASCMSLGGSGHLWAAPGPRAEAVRQAETPEALYLHAKASFDRLLGDKGRKKGREIWLPVLHEFRKVYLHHPDNPEFAPKALFMMGRTYLEIQGDTQSRDDLDEAIKRFEILAEKFPENSLSDDSLYVLGCLYEGLGERNWAREKWDRIVSSYPQGDQYEKAVKKLEAYGKTGGEEAKTTADGAMQTTQEVTIDGFQVSIAASPPPQQLGKPRRARIREIQPLSVDDYTRVVIETSGPVSFKEGRLPSDREHGKPARFYLDFTPATKGEDLAGKVELDNGLLKGVRVAQFDAETVRVVFDLGTTQNIKVFNLENPYRIVVDAFAPGYSESFTCPAPKKAPPKTVLKKGQKPSLAQQLGLCVQRVVIDAGHGGRDPGAIGPTGLKEKDVVLKISKKVGKALEDRLGCEVIYTRDRDIFIPLEQRTAIANAKKADLFVSIHVNAAPDPEVKGVETYFLNFAVDDHAMRVAALENATSSKRIGELQGILNDILKNAKVDESSRLAGFVQKNMINTMKASYPAVRDLGVKQAPFFVLIGAQMPSVLVETSFISNEEEEKRLRDDAYVSTLADGIVQGLVSYAQGTVVSSIGNDS